jgi:hypothetical protein
MTNPATIYQIYYRDDQTSHLDSSFIPYNNEGDKDPLLEFNVFRKIYRSEEHDKGALWGALSWKFTQKTGLTGEVLQSFIRENPGYDVYFCNPFPEFEAIYQNLWAQGETAHPDFISLNEKVFELIGLPHNLLLEEIHPRTAFAATNSFVGSTKFWQAYMTFVENILDQVSKKGGKELIEKLHCSSADVKGVHAGATYLPFIVERLFSVFLNSEEAKGLKAIKYALPEAEKQMNVHLKHLREMKDAAWKSKSVWMASCWLNYRNLYLTQRHGVKWAKKYLPIISPRKLVFSDFSELDELVGK